MIFSYNDCFKTVSVEHLYFLSASLTKLCVYLHDYAVSAIEVTWRGVIYDRII
jgi:hypothetical protein